jgi:hypothetical protein
MPVSWKPEPDDHDYPAAGDYLALLAEPAAVDKLVAELKSAPIVYKKAKDILRACRLRLLHMDNPHVKSDLAKIKKHNALSPILFADPAGPRRPRYRGANADRRRLPAGLRQLPH